MGVTTAAWLGALATLAVPLAIHLWSRRRTTPVAIGSIRFLHSVKPVSTRTIRLRHPWRLLLRAALLASLILALAGAYFDRILPRPEPQRWLVVGPAADDSGVTPIIDSIAADADNVLLAPGDVWSLLASLDATLPPGSSIDVVAPTATVRGTRPAIASSVRWFPLGVSSDNAGQTPTRWSGSHRHLAVLASRDRWDDGRYLTAALQAIVAQDSIPATVQLLETTALDGLAATWIAWLSADATPTALLDRTAAGGVLLTDISGEQHNVTTTVTLAEPAKLNRRGPMPAGVPVWRDGNGVTLLSAEPIGNGIHYRLATRLHPAWTDLVLRGSFPATLIPLVGNAQDVPRQHVTAAQVLPRRSNTLAGKMRAAGPGRSLFVPLWLLAACLFAIDVGLSYRQRRVSE